MSDEKREGPRVTLDASCLGCKYESTERYRVQGDSGCNVSCTHPDVTGDREVGDTTWSTPAWCPLLPLAIAQVVDTERRKLAGG